MQFNVQFFFLNDAQFCIEMKCKIQNKHLRTEEEQVILDQVTPTSANHTRLNWSRWSLVHDVF